MKMRVVYIIMVFLLFLGVSFYVFYRLWRLMPAVTAGRVLLVAAAVLLTGSIFLYIWSVGTKASMGLTAFAYKVGTSWIMIFVFVLLALLLLDIVRLTKLVPREYIGNGSWVAFGSVVGLVAVLTVVGNIVYHNKKRVELDIAVEKGLGGRGTFKMVAVSDLHLGYGIGAKELSRWVEMINREDPDIVVLAGDVVDTDTGPLHEFGMARVLGELKPKHGVFAVLGNHEYISGAAESAGFLKEAGITVLQDSAALIDGAIYVVGRDDRSNPLRKPLKELTAGLDASKPVIVLDHQPSDLAEAMDAGADLQFSGHTHYGQVWPISWITRAIFEKSYGQHRKGDTHYYVSSGLGIWGGKYRIGSRSEYVVINIVRAEYRTGN